MTRSQRVGLALAAAALLASTSLTPAGAIPWPAKIVGEKPWALKPGEWPQDRSDVKPDPAVIYGALPNGFRYAIRRQTFPAGQAAVRLWIDGGSVDERDDQQGLAHFLEHMAFDGSKAVPSGEMTHMLERLGLRMGPDTNAFTSFPQTVYQFDLPKSDEGSLDTAVMLMREIAGNLSLDEGAMEKERGAVLSEERAGDTPGYRALKAQYAFLAPGQRLIERYPIGKVEVLKNAKAGQVADLYRRYYRPDRAVLVVVGDFDPASVEAKIKARFSDWRGVGPAGADPDLGQVKPRGSEARLVVDQGLQNGVSISWTSPPDLTPDTVAQEIEGYIRDLGFAVLNRRLADLAQQPNPPFLGASAGRSDLQHSVEVTSLSAAAAPGKIPQALAAIEQERRRILQYGVRPEELAREIADSRTALAATAAAADTRHPPQLANELVRQLPDQEILTSPAQNLARFEAAVKGLTPEAVDAELRKSFKGYGPLIFATAPTPLAGGEAGLLADYKASAAKPVEPPAAQAQVAWPYESFGPPGKVADSRRIDDLDVTFVRFANGVRLTVKPTKFTTDQVMVEVRIGHGRGDLPKDRQNDLWAAGALMAGGLGKIDVEEMRRALSGRFYSATFGVADDAFVFSGGAQTKDLPTEMQVMAAYVSDPAWRQKAFDRIKQASATIHDQLASTEGGVFARDAGGLLHSGDKRWTFPSQAQIDETQLADVRGELQPHIDAGPIDVTVVGDVTVDQATDLVARTLGALPPRPAWTPPPADQLKVAFPAPTPQPIVRTHKGRADQALVFVAWPTADFWSDLPRARGLDMLAQVLQLRLFEQLRRSEGVTYSPSAGSATSDVWPGYGFLQATVEVPPEKIDAVLKDIAQIAADLRAKPIPQDELDRAKTPAIDTVVKQRATNAYWLSVLGSAQSQPKELEAIRTQIPQKQAITPADLQRLAQAYLRDDTAWKLVVKPEAK